MRETTDRPQCVLRSHAAAYLINGMLYLCEDCRDDIGDEWENVITVEEIDNDDERED